MKLSIFAYSRQGQRTASRIAEGFDAALYAPERLAGEGFLPIEQPTAAFYGERFRKSGALIFVSSCGIAVRCIAPHIRTKTDDPAVIAVDELGHFVIPLLSGHVGGANELAGQIADRLGATPVVTTATDINGRFSVDSWARYQGLIISDMGAAKEVSAAVLEGDVPFASDITPAGDMPRGLVTGNTGGIGVYVTYTVNEPFRQTLRLIPKCLHLGIGCKRGTPKENIDEAVRTVFEEHRLDFRAVKCAASIDLKQDEEGLLEFCRENGVPVSFHSAECLNGVRGEFTSSDFVKKVTGVDSVCERAALVGADELIVKKTALGGVTVAVALEKTEVRFG